MRASCTWGDGPDVLVILDGKHLMCYENPDNFEKAVHGFVTEGSFELTSMEALKLASDLLIAARASLFLDESIRKEHHESRRSE